jgi:glutathione S-transferase
MNLAAIRRAPEGASIEAVLNGKSTPVYLEPSKYAEPAAATQRLAVSRLRRESRTLGAMSVLYVGNRNYSSWSVRGSLLVRQSGIPCTEVVIPLDTDAGMAKIAAVSPSRRVPVLHVDGLVIWESLAIAEFLHERAPDAGIWPVEPTARALARCVSAEMHSGFGTLRAQMPMDVRGRHAVPGTPELRRDVERIEQIWRECRARHARAGDYLFGAWCAADAMFAPVVSRFRTYGVALSRGAQQYADAVWKWPALMALAAEAAAEPWSLDLGLSP